MNKLIDQINAQTIVEADDSSAELTKDGKKANKEISQLGFSLIKDMINTDKEITGTDVADYLKKADTINDEVDTVVFGLETDDDAIVKVYVNVTDADAFEKAMAEKLGTEDDLEDVIAELAQEYDIVDVEWPEGEDEDEEEDTTDDAETQNSADEETEEAAFEINFDEPQTTKESIEGDDEMTTLGESFKQKVLGDTLVENKIKEEDWPKEIKGLAKTLTTPAQESILFLIASFGLPPEVLGSKKAVGLFRRNIIATSREYQKNQTLKLWINKLIKELNPNLDKEEKEKPIDAAKIKEAVEKVDLAPDWENPDLVKAGRFRDTLPRGVPRLIFDLLIALGVPQVMLTDINKSKVREAIRAFTRVAKTTQRIRIYLNLIAEALGIKREDQTETAAHIASRSEMKEETLIEAPESDYSAVVRELLIELGVPADNIVYQEAAVIRSFKKRKMQLNFAVVTRKLELFINFIKKNELKSVNEAMEADYFALVNELSQVLGLPASNMTYKEAAVIRSIKKRKTQINAGVITPKLEKLIEFVRKNEIKQESIKDLTRKVLGEEALPGSINFEVNRAKKSTDPKELDEIARGVKMAANHYDMAANIIYAVMHNKNVGQETLEFLSKSKDAGVAREASKLLSTVTEGKIAKQIQKLLDAGATVKSAAVGRAGMTVDSVDGKTVHLSRGKKGYATTFDSGDKVKIEKVGDNEYKIVNDAEEVEKIMKRSSGEDKASNTKDKVAAADRGSWSFANLGGDGGVALKARGISVKIPQSSAEKAVKAIGEGKPATVKTTTGTRIVFSPRDRGQSYVIAGIEKFENGVKMSKEDVERFLDTLASE